MICDRKFYIRDMLKVNLETIEANQVLIMILQDQVKLKEKECKGLDEDMDYFKAMKEEEGEQIEGDLEQVKRK
jgi:hypothetical protein